MLVVATLDGRCLRFTELHKHIPGTSQRMLTLTLRNLERDGLVSRTAYAEVPPRVEYALTPMGKSLIPPALALAGWPSSTTQRSWRAETRTTPRRVEVHGFTRGSMEPGIRCLRPASEVLERFTYKKRCQPVPDASHEVPHRVRVRLPVLSQCPADGLADEEGGVPRLAQAVAKEALGVGRVLVRSWWSRAVRAPHAPSRGRAGRVGRTPSPKGTGGREHWRMPLHGDRRVANLGDTDQWGL